MTEKKFSHFSHIEKIWRKNHILKPREKYHRLDKNEMISNFEKPFLNKIKKKIKSFHINTYPNINDVHKKLAKSLKVGSDNIILTSGSDLAIKNCFELFVRKNNEVITINPTYGMINIYSKLFQAKQIQINYEKDLTINISKILKKINRKTSLIVIPNPNSPIGSVIDQKNIIKILSKAKKNNCYVLIDECYYHYYEKTSLNLIRRFSNLVISRSFSKIGLAGCRIGFLITNKPLRSKLYKFRPFYEITSFSVLLLNEFLENKNIMKKYAQETKKGKQYLEKYFTKNNIYFFPTAANFILIVLKNKNITNKIFNQLLKNRILVVVEKNIPHYKNVIKFTVGPEQMMRKVVKAINKVVENQK